MDSKQARDRVRYMLEVSSTGLGNTTLARWNEAANVERDLRDRLRELVEELAWARFGQLLREHGEEIAEYFGSPRRRRPR